MAHCAPRRDDASQVQRRGIRVAAQTRYARSDESEDRTSDKVSGASPSIKSTTRARDKTSSSIKVDVVRRNRLFLEIGADTDN